MTHQPALVLLKSSSSSLSLLPRLLLSAILLTGLSSGAHASSQSSCGGKAPDALISSLQNQAPTLRAEVLRLALDASGCAARKGLVKRSELLTVIDYSLPSTEPRLFVFDLAARRLLFHELVAHGRTSGGMKTSAFSNIPGSNASSIGLFVTANTYIGRNGYSLRLKGLEAGFNDRAWDRAIVMHGASYVSEATARALGRLGRSQGCPAVRPQIARKLIDTLKEGTPIIAYYPDQQWLSSSRFLR
jgi:hypothetical protein